MGYLFQSSPAPRGRRYLKVASRGLSKNMFQSSPAPRGRRYIRPTTFNAPHKQVSILARPEGQALLPTAAEKRRYDVVSILARPEGQALPWCTPAACAGLLFQSSPAPRGRRYFDWHQHGYAYKSCFNPRPPRGAGATRAPLRGPSPHILFQSSPAPRGRRYFAAVTFRCERFNSGLGANLGAPRRQDWVW